MKNLPALRYNFRNPIVNPMNPNYKFSRRIEMSVFGRKGVREFIDRNFRPEKAQMTEEDLGTPDTQANIVFYTYSGVQMYKLTTRGKDMKKLKLLPERPKHRTIDYANLHNPFEVVAHTGNKGSEKRNPHKSYGYLVQPRLGTWLVDFLLGRLR